MNLFLLRNIWAHNILKNLEATSKFLPPEGWYEARSILRAHKHWRRRTKFGARDLCILEKYTQEITQH
jgi:hypothetical protein